MNCSSSPPTTHKQGDGRGTQSGSSTKGRADASSLADPRRQLRSGLTNKTRPAGGIPRVLRTRRIVDAHSRPSLNSSPWIRWYPEPVFSVASRGISAVIPALTGGRPARWGKSTSWRPGGGATAVRCWALRAGASAAASAGAGSAQRGPRGRPSSAGPRMGAAQHGDSCRSTSSSASLEARWPASG